MLLDTLQERRWEMVLQTSRPGTAAVEAPAAANGAAAGQILTKNQKKKVKKRAKKAAAAAVASFNAEVTSTEELFVLLVTHKPCSSCWWKTPHCCFSCRMQDALSSW